MILLKTSKITKKCWIEDCIGNKLTDKFKAERRLIKRVGPYVYIPCTNIGNIVYHEEKGIILIHDWNLYSFMQLTEKLYVACSNKNLEKEYFLYNEKAEFLGQTINFGNTSEMLGISYIKDAGIPVLNDGKKYFVNYLGEVC